LLTVCEFFRPYILAATHQEIKGVKKWFPSMKEQITELRPPALIQTDNLAIEDGFPSEGQSRSPAKILKELKGFPLREMS
jgi:hypothetical protein